jgi:hypothetical protein
MEHECWSCGEDCDCGADYIDDCDQCSECYLDDERDYDYDDTSYR